jgi:hypothetical protein
MKRHRVTRGLAGTITALLLLPWPALAQAARTPPAWSITYEITVSDPATWVRPWTALIHLRRSDDTIYESACHEGNLEVMRASWRARARRSRGRDEKTHAQ